MEGNYKSLSDTLPFWHFDNDLMAFSDGSLGRGFKLTGIDISCMTPSEVNQFSQTIENLLTVCGEGLRLQVFYRLMPDVSELLNKHVEVSKTAMEVYGEIKQARVDFLQENEKEGNFYMPEIFFFVRSKPHNFKKRKFWEKEKKYTSITLDKYETHKERFLRSCKQIESSLKHSKLGPKVLTSKEWFNLAFDYFGLGEGVGYCAFRHNYSP